MTATQQYPVAPAVNAASFVTNASGNKANASAAATLAKEAGKMLWITGFVLTGSGATTGVCVNATLTGVASGTMTFSFVFPAGVLVQATPLVVNFSPPLPAADDDTSIVLTLPASGAGGTNASATAFGYRT